MPVDEKDVMLDLDAIEREINEIAKHRWHDPTTWDTSVTRAVQNAAALLSALRASQEREKELQNASVARIIEVERDTYDRCILIAESAWLDSGRGKQENNETIMQIVHLIKKRMLDEPARRALSDEGKEESK